METGTSMFAPMKRSRSPSRCQPGTARSKSTTSGVPLKSLVQLPINKSIRAESQAKIEEARKEVILDITEEQGLLKLYVNGPFRCHCDEGCGHREFEGYIVKMDFQIQVPRDIDIKIKTVNEG